MKVQYITKGVMIKKDNIIATKWNTILAEAKDKVTHVS